MTASTHILAPSAVFSYVTAGKAIVTVLNTKTDGRCTYKVQAAGRTAAEQLAAEILFVSVLVGPENNSHYKYIGIIIRRSGEFKTTAKTKLPLDDARLQGFAWLLRNSHRLENFPHVEVRHHNNCGKCGRTLTVPASVDTGLGPVCARTLGITWQIAA